MVQVCVYHVGKGIVYCKGHGKYMIILWKQTWLPFTVQFQLNYSVTSHILLSNNSELKWYKFVFITLERESYIAKDMVSI